MEILDNLLRTDFSAGSQPLLEFVRALLVAFVVGQLNAWCYKWTHRGVSYARTFTQSLILICLAGAISMFLVLSNPLAAFGLLGGMAIIRFRTVVRDAKDNAYVLLSLICGLAAGFGHLAVAIVGSVGANAVAVYLHWTGFGARLSNESLLRLQIASAGLESGALDRILRWFCYKVSMVSVDESPVGGAEGVKWYQCVYKVRLRDPATASNLVTALEADANTGTVRLLVDQGNEDVV